MIRFPVKNLNYCLLFFSFKWYQKLSDIVSIETSQRESAEGGRQVVPSPESLEILPERRSKRERKPPKVKVKNKSNLLKEMSFRTL